MEKTYVEKTYVEKKYIVRLTRGQRQSAQLVVDKLDGSPQKVTRAQILLKADQRAGGWTEATNARQRGVDWQFTVENARIKLKHLYPQSKCG